MDRRPDSGKWSARENLAHLARYQQVFLERVARIVDEHEPTFARYKAEDDPEWPSWAALPLAEVSNRLRAGRAKIIAKFGALSDEQLARVGVHARFGPLTLVQWLEFFLLHEAHHLLAVLQRARERD
jgi:uncharacterized damage-inducible protein DinB